MNTDRSESLEGKEQLAVEKEKKVNKLLEAWQTRLPNEAELSDFLGNDKHE